MNRFRNWCSRPIIKYPLIGITALLWLVGFADQIHDPIQAGKYVGITLAMCALWAIV